MDDRKYVFVGNRECVLQKMLDMQLDIKAVYVMENSFLQRWLDKQHVIDYIVISKKKQLLEYLSETDYDVLISNGCKYILPIDDMKQALYINIHPSFLPDLKGMDPINGACLFNRTAGAACHIIDSGIDTGKIISRVSIPMTDEIDAPLLFQLSFKAEAMVFSDAYDCNFTPLDNQPINNEAIYYTINKTDLLIDFDEAIETLTRKSKAFGYKSKGLYFKCSGKVYRCFRITEVNNPFVVELAEARKNREVIVSFDNTVIIKTINGIIRLDNILYDDDTIKEGQFVDNCSIDDLE